MRGSDLLVCGCQVVGKALGDVLRAGVGKDAGGDSPDVGEYATGSDRLRAVDTEGSPVRGNNVEQHLLCAQRRMVNSERGGLSGRQVATAARRGPSSPMRGAQCAASGLWNGLPDVWIQPLHLAATRAGIDQQAPVNGAGERPAQTPLQLPSPGRVSQTAGAVAGAARTAPRKGAGDTSSCLVDRQRGAVVASQSHCGDDGGIDTGRRSDPRCLVRIKIDGPIALPSTRGG